MGKSSDLCHLCSASSDSGRPLCQCQTDAPPFLHVGTLILDFHTLDRFSHIGNEGKEQAYQCIFGDWDNVMKKKQSNP